MAKIDKYIIDRVLAAAKIEEVVGDFVRLRKKGPRYLGLCPFHDDRHATNFSVYPKQNVFKCFACGEGGDSVSFLMKHEHLSFPDAIRWLGKKYSIETDVADFNYTPPPPRPVASPLPTLTLPFWMVTAKEHTDNDRLAQWIKTGIHWDSIQWSRIDKVFHEYHLGHSTVNRKRRDGSVVRHEFTIFWQIDECGNVRTGHMMKYRPDGHRIKKDQDSYDTDWIHAMLKGYRDEPPYPYPQYFDPDRQEKRNTLFGMHLLNKYPNATVCIVESEKTALLMAIAYGNHIKQVWMSCAGLQNLNQRIILPLIKQQRNIILYPDRDGIANWKSKAEALHYAHVRVDEKPVTEWWKPQDGEKADIADVVVRMINTKKIYKTVDEVVDDLPQLKELKERLNLELHHDEGKT